MPATPLKDTFKAEMDRIPGTEAKLVVTGEVEVPTTGWTVSLTCAHPQGINPRDLILDLHAKAPTGAAGDIVLKPRVEFHEQPPRADYDRVTIRFGHEVFSISVPVLV